MRETKVKVKIARKEGDFIITGRVSTDFSLITKAKRLYEEIIAESELVKATYKSKDGAIVSSQRFDYPIVFVDQDIGIISSPQGSEKLQINLSAISDIEIITSVNHFDYTIKFKLHSGEIIFNGILA